MSITWYTHRSWPLSEDVWFNYTLSQGAWHWAVNRLLQHHVNLPEFWQTHLGNRGGRTHSLFCLCCFLVTRSISSSRDSSGEAYSETEQILRGKLKHMGPCVRWGSVPGGNMLFCYHAWRACWDTATVKQRPPKREGTGLFFNFFSRDKCV